MKGKVVGAVLDLPFTTDIHMRLLLRLDRGHNVRQAVMDAVSEGDRVLDAGTGTGLLAFFALAAGASDVVAVDRQHISLAQALASENGFDDKIQFLEVDLTGLALPEVDMRRRFDVLLAFVYANHILVDEERARMVFELRDRFCTDNCAIVPGGIRYMVTGCNRTDWDYYTELADLSQAAEVLRSGYKLSFDTLVTATSRQLAMSSCRPTSPELPGWRPPGSMAAIRFPRDRIHFLSEPSHVCDIDYRASACPGLPAQVTLEVANPGRLNGVIWTQDLLYNGRAVWTSETFSPLDPPRFVSRGEKVALDIGDQWRTTNIVTEADPGFNGYDHQG